MQEEVTDERTVDSLMSTIAGASPARLGASQEVMMRMQELEGAGPRVGAGLGRGRHQGASPCKFPADQINKATGDREARTIHYDLNLQAYPAASSSSGLFYLTGKQSRCLSLPPSKITHLRFPDVTFQHAVDSQPPLL